MTRPSALVWHPFLFALYPVLLLYSRSAKSVFFSETVPAAVIVSLLTLGGWIVIRRVWVDSVRAGLITSAMLFVIFSFERNVYTLQIHGLGGSPSAREWWVLSMELIGLGAGIWFLHVQPQLVRPLHTTANATSIILIGLLCPSLIEAVRSTTARDPKPASDRTAKWKTETSGSRPLADKPDIYFIVLDAYGRSDVLRAVFGYDNRAWLSRMELKGFFLASESTANYCQTALSLTATLNGEYHDRLAGSPSDSRLPLRTSFQNCLIPHFFQANGYKLVSFASGFGLSDGFPADARFAPRPDIGEFDSLLLDMTPLWIPLGAGTGRASHRRHRDRILYLFDHLVDIASDPQPTFCLAHVVAPHPPFVFDRDGNDISGQNPAYRLTDGKHWSDMEGHGGPDDYIEHYRNQATYVAARVEMAVDQILARSPRRPIIIIQSDHGPGSHFDPNGALPNDLFERMGVLNLILMPHQARERFFSSITPINTFRIVCDHLFQTDLGLLPDRNYYSSYEKPYQLTEVTDQLPRSKDEHIRQTASSPDY